MSLHLIKLSVGSESIQTLNEWQNTVIAKRRKENKTPELSHITRMVPKRQEELLKNGSIYWVIKGITLCRQKLLGIETFIDADGVRRCHLVLDPEFVAVENRPHRPFQGWRYLKASDAPPDLIHQTGDTNEMPAEMRRELAELGLL